MPTKFLKPFEDILADITAADAIFKAHEWPQKWSATENSPLDDHARSKITSLKQGAIAALSATVLEDKIALTRSTARAWFNGQLAMGGDRSTSPPDRPGRPSKPNLVPPNRVKRRSVRSDKGRFALLHAIAHIELNAIDLALDIVARFADQKMPRSFFDGWIRVALEEAKHFSLLQERLEHLGGAYGDLDAHDGLWEAAQDTGHSLTARLAVVPLILEARGLDITPSLIAQMREVGDEPSANIFEIIYRDEQGHVAVGAKWFRFLCHKEKRDPVAAFNELVRTHFRGHLKPPFNDSARSRAGLTPIMYRALSSAGH